MLLVNSPTTSAGTTLYPLAAPDDARAAILTVVATTDGTGTVDAKVVQYAPGFISTTNVDVPGAAIDQMPISQTAKARYLMWGDQVTATAGTSIDIVSAPVSQYQQLSVTVVATVTNLKIWVEYVR